MLRELPWWQARRPQCPTGCRGDKPTGGRSRTNPSPSPSTQQPQYYEAPPQYAPPAPAPAAAPADDPIERLKQLAELRDQGILTEEEFTAAKAKVLAG